MNIQDYIAAAFRRLFRNGVDESGPVSLVLLLKAPAFWDGNELATAIARAASIFSGDESTEQFVTGGGERAVLYIKPHLMALLTANRPYFGQDPSDYSKSLPSIEQQVAWSSHKAWAAIDYLKGDENLAEEYRVLSSVAGQLLSDNCSGVYVPRERRVFANDEHLQAFLGDIVLGKQSPQGSPSSQEQ
jgi:hypothetical protein